VHQIVYNYSKVLDTKQEKLRPGKDAVSHTWLNKKTCYTLCPLQEKCISPVCLTPKNDYVSKVVFLKTVTLFSLRDHNSLSVMTVSILTRTVCSLTQKKAGLCTYITIFIKKCKAVFYYAYLFLKKNLYVNSQSYVIFRKTLPLSMLYLFDLFLHVP
jgi:hypothetical protein